MSGSSSPSGSSSASAGLSIRLVIASLCSLAAAVLMRSWNSDLPWILWAPTGLLAVSALLIHRKSLGGQMLARAAWWANLLLGAVIALAGSSSERSIAFGLALVCGTALLAVGRTGLGSAASGRFNPVAFRASLTLALVMAMADAQSLLLFGGLELDSWHSDQPPILLFCAGVMLVAIIGLYRLALWGLVLNLAANIVIAAMAIGGVFDLPGPIVFMLASTAVIQSVLPIPLIIRFFSRRDAVESRTTSRLGHVVVTLAIAGLMLLSTAAWLSETRLISSF